MPDEHPDVDDHQDAPAVDGGASGVTPEPAAQRAGAVAAPPRASEPLLEREEWLDDGEELPRRPRRRMLTPLPLALLAILAIACGFIAGVLVEKGQGGGSSGTGAGAGGAFASRFAALRGGSGSTSSSASGSSAGAGATGAGAGTGRLAGAGGLGGAGSGTTSGSGATIGQVAYVSNGVLYVTTLEGNTVKVTAGAGSTVTKSVKTSTSGIHPGETVVVTGTAGANGAIAAQSIRAGSAGAGGFGGAGAALLGGSGRPSGAASGAAGGSGGSGSTSGGSGGGEQALFGKG